MLSTTAGDKERTAGESRCPERGGSRERGKTTHDVENLLGDNNYGGGSKGCARSQHC